MAWNPFKAVGNAVRGLFGGRSEVESPPVTQQPEPRQPEPRQPEPQEQRGFFGKLIDRVTGRAERERERELQERERQLAEREKQVEQKERQVEEKERQAREPKPEPKPAETKEPKSIADQVRESIEKDRQSRQAEADRREQQRQESIQKEQQRQAERAEERQKQADAILGKYKPVQPLGDKGRLGAIYTDASGNEIMRRLSDAAAVDHRVTLKILKADGTWVELFKEGGRRAGRGIQASHLRNIIEKNGGGDLSAWIGGGCTGIEGTYEDDLLEDAVGYQLVETY